MDEKELREPKAPKKLTRRQALGLGAAGVGAVAAHVGLKALEATLGAWFILDDRKERTLRFAESSALLIILMVREQKYREYTPATIYAGLRTGHPELAKSLLTEEGIERLDDLYAMVAYTNSFNSIVDDREGPRRILASNPNHPHQDILEAAMEGLTTHFNEQRRRMVEIFRSHRRSKEVERIAEVFQRDLWDLVVKGEQDISKYDETKSIERRELDNSIFVVACAAAVYGTDKFPRIYGPGADQKTIRERYGWLLDSSVPKDPYEHWLKALHKTYIAGGIFDDLQGVEDDSKLGIITYPVYLKEKGLSREEIRERIEQLSGKYIQEATDLGMSRLLKVLKPGLIRFADFMAEYPQRKKDQWAQQELSLEKLREGGVVYLREKLNAHGYLEPD